MKDRFDLEDDIMNMYRIVEDLNLFYEKQDMLSEDERDNVLLGIKTITPLRIDKLFNTFKEVLELDEFHPDRKDRTIP